MNVVEDDGISELTQVWGAGAGGMSDAQIADFVNYFWKALHPELFIELLLESGADLVVRIKADRSLDAIYSH